MVSKLSLRPPAFRSTRRLFLAFLLLVSVSFLAFFHITEKRFFFLAGKTDRSGFILDTEGCRIPKLDPFDQSLRKLIVLKEPYVCPGHPMFFITKPNATIVLNRIVLNVAYKVSPENVSCHYKAIRREKEMRGRWGENAISMSGTKSLQFGVPLDDEFLKIQCNVGNPKSNHYIPLVPLKPEVEKNKGVKDRAGALNVILIGIDSVSKLNFLRHFKRTHNFLTTNLSAFDMKGYVKVGDNTFPNLVPLLTGHFVEHYWNESIRKHMFFDHLDFIWKTYSNRGYRTFYAEDSPHTGTFNYLKRGFKNPPTDYYFRPLGLAMRNSLKKNCMNSQLDIEILYEYLKDFMKTMGKKPSFSFTMVSTLTHDYLNWASYADLPTYNLLKDLWQDGVMNESLVIIFSDHGIRFGAIRETYIGKFEERMPFMYMLLPRWFLHKNHSVARNLKMNQNRLITLFDVHATLCHLLNASDPKAYSNGQSLFEEITEHRTCEVANILPHWCPCRAYRYMPTNDEMAIKAAAAVVDEINKQLKPFRGRCARLDIAEITDARIGQSGDLNKHKNYVSKEFTEKKNGLENFLVTLRASPGGGLFEGTVRHNSDRTMSVLGISRINEYEEEERLPHSGSDTIARNRNRPTVKVSQEEV